MANISEAKKISMPQEQSRPEAPEIIRLRVATAQSAHDARAVEERTAEATTHSADAADGVARHALAQGHEAIRNIGEGIARATAHAANATADTTRDVTHRAAGQDRRLAETSARVSDVYYDAAQRSAEDVQALVGAYSAIGRGIPEYQRAYFELLNRSMESMARKWQDAFRVKSPVELAKVQRDLYLDGVSNLFTGSTTLLQLAGQIAQNAVRPLQERAHGRGQG